MKAITALRSLIVIGGIVPMLLIPVSVSAHYGDASGACKDNVGVITAHFHKFGEELFGDVVVAVDGAVIDHFQPTKADFDKTYQPYAEGMHTVQANWAIDKNHNGKTEEGEKFSFSDHVKIENCKPKEQPKCEVKGKENLLKGDPNCKEDKCAVPGKTDLPKSDPKCKEDTVVLGERTELPNTGMGADVVAEIFAGVSVSGAAAHAVVSRRRR